MSATKTTASGILKNVYEGPIVDQINNPNVLLKFINRNARDIVEGSRIVGSIRLRPSQGLGARAEMVALPQPLNTTWAQPYDTLKHLYGVMRLSGPLIRATENMAAAFNRAVKAEAEGMVTGLQLDMQRQTYGSEAGDGRIAVCGVTSSSLTIQLATGTNMRYFEVGMLVDILVLGSTAVSNGTGRSINAIDETNYTITIDTAAAYSGADSGTVSTTAADGIYRNGSLSGEINGLEQVISTSSLHNIDPATSGNGRWQGNVDTNFGAFSILAFQARVDNSHNRSGKWVTHIFSQEGPRNAYLAELQGLRHIVQQANSIKLDGGFSGLEYTGGGETAIWFKDPYAKDAATIYGVRLSDLELKRYSDWKFMDINGEYWLPDIYGATGVDAFKAVMYMDVQLWAKVRNSHFKLQNVVSVPA